MILFQQLAFELPGYVRLTDPYSIQVRDYYKAITQNLPRSILLTYPTEDSFRRAIHAADFALEGNGFLFYFYKDGGILDAHGVFLSNPFRNIPILKSCLRCLFLASTFHKIQITILHAGNLRSLGRLLGTLGFSYEGHLRRAFRDLQGVYTDGDIFGILREEVIDGS